MDNAQVDPVINPEQLIEGDLFELLELQDLPEDQKDEIRGKVMESIGTRILLRIADILPEEDFEAFKKHAESQNNDEMNTLLSKHNIDLNAVTIEEALILKGQLVNGISVAKQARA